jgi:hypothetical protein
MSLRGTLMTLSKMVTWELKQIFKGKKFTISFIIQFFVILAIIPLFDVYSNILEDPQEIILPTSYAYVPVAVFSSPLEEMLQNHDIFRVYTVSEQEGYTLLEQHVVCCFITGETIFFDSYNPKARVAEFHLQRLLQEEPGATISWVLNERPVVPRQQLVARQIALREIRRTAEMMQSEQINYSTLLVLLLAIFLASGILVELIVSEKEKRTGEILLSLPISNWRIILSKVCAVVIVLSTQITLWILTLYALGRVSHLLSMLPLFLTAFLIVSLTCFVSVYAKSYKEAGFAITISYVLLFAFLMSASAFYIFSDKFSFLSPLSMVIMIEQGKYAFLDIVYAALPVFLVSCLFIFVSIKMYGRDEFYFGPRPSFFRLIISIAPKILLITVIAIISYVLVKTLFSLPIELNGVIL